MPASNAIWYYSMGQRVSINSYEGVVRQWRKLCFFLYSYFESLGFFLINPFFHLHSFNVQDNTLILISVSRLENTLSVFVCFTLFNIRVEISLQHFYCSSKWRHDIKPLHSFFENNTVHLLGMFSVIRGINKEIKGESLQKYR